MSPSWNIFTPLFLMSFFERTLKTSQWLPADMAPTGSCFDTETVPVQNGTAVRKKQPSHGVRWFPP